MLRDKLRKEEIDVLNYCVNVKLELPPGEEELDVCKAWEDMRQETIEETTEKVTKVITEKVTKAVTVKVEKETEEKTLLQDIRNLMETLQLSAEQAMRALKVPEERHIELTTKLSID